MNIQQKNEPLAAMDYDKSSDRLPYQFIAQLQQHYDTVFTAGTQTPIKLSVP